MYGLYFSILNIEFERGYLILNIVSMVERLF